MTCPCDEQTRAQVLWLAESQQVLVKDKNFRLWQVQFDLFQDDKKIWRCRGRLQNADVPIATKYPILLSPAHALTALLVKQAHERVMHSGVKATLTELRSQFWILKGRSAVKGILRRCIVCRRFKGKPYAAPPPLPPFRLEEAPPFTHTGVDFAGPLYVKQSDSTSGKVWICLYTCCVVRAVHLDLLPDLTTSTFIRSFKRFASRRGLPAKMVSDNGKTFKAAAKVIESIVTSREVQQHFMGLGVQWIFNLPKAPWWGGMFERLIGSMKRCLRKVIGQARFSYDELLTAVVEAEAVLNSRPLSYISTDDLEEPLSPSHLLIGRRILSLPDYISCGQEEGIDDIQSEVLDKRTRYLNLTLNKFWGRWRKEYLLELRESHRYHRGHANPSQVSVDDVVLVHSTEQPRAFWKLGRVKEVLVGKDGAIRGAVLRLARRGRRATLLQRPVQLLYPLEVPGPCQKIAVSTDRTSTVDQDLPEETQIANDVHECTTSQRPRRAAAVQARDRLMAQALAEY